MYYYWVYIFDKYRVDQLSQLGILQALMVPEYPESPNLWETFHFMYPFHFIQIHILFLGDWSWNLYTMQLNSFSVSTTLASSTRWHAIFTVL